MNDTPQPRPLSELGALLYEEVERTSYRRLGSRLGLSKKAIENIVKGNLTEPPELNTFIRIAEGFHLPLWKVLEMYGIKADIPSSRSRQAAMLDELTRQLPGTESLVSQMLRMHPDDVRSVSAYLTALAAQRRQRVERLSQSLPANEEEE